MDLQLLIAESAQLLVIGMGTVFIILVMLIFLINTVSRLLPEEKVEPIKPARIPTPRASSQAASNDGQLVAVIGAAVQAYRNRQHS
jgi:oxaloacetate decarboxylase gamma subunit